MALRKLPAIFILLVAGCLMGSRPLTLHDFHASVTQMQYNPKEKSFEISIRIFTDDFEKALSAVSGSKIALGPNDKNDPLIEKYILSHFSYVSPQKQTKPIKYVGHEIEVDANWLYLEMPYAEPFRGGSLKQNVLMEFFDDQVNMVNIQYQGQKKTFVFRKNQPVQDVSVD
ncbi:DUF6702 family protein [Spirosoma sp. KNUC1025]|uniref:DUF6702 family protein n=1 Tax=Spirosoma sp. KNUC1025 TaxID=2894082 RepID=UPI00386DC364|nr:hypothetical protein LN737_30215 [Spirosoma sp. KNUC1025]